VNLVVRKHGGVTLSAPHLGARQSQSSVRPKWVQSRSTTWPIGDCANVYASGAPTPG
jgi:hypothetical protein